MRRFFTKKRGKTGFTLVEILITITIIGIISVSTFAIVISSMNTFRKEQDIVKANAMKDDICLIVQGRLRTRQKMSLLNENLANSRGYNPGVASDVQFGAAQHDANGYYVIDPRVEEMHMIFSDGGRIYTVDSNLDSKYYVDAQPAHDALQVIPTSTMDVSGLAGECGRKPIMVEELYKGYYVDLKFKPIFNNRQGRYRDLQIIVTIFDDATMTEEHQVAKGTETFHLLNIENMQTSIKFFNNTATQAANPSNKSPEPDGYKFCYYV